MSMKMNYTAPEIEVIEVAIEQGFASSVVPDGDPTYDGWGSENPLF